MISNVKGADLIFHIVFFVVLTSMLLQGTTLYSVAKLLDLEEPPPKKKTPKALSLSEEVKSELLEIKIPKNSRAANKQILEIGLPKSALVVLVNRDKNYVTPRGDTVLLEKDKLMIMTDTKKDIKLINETFAPLEETKTEEKSK